MAVILFLVCPYSTSVVVFLSYMFILCGHMFITLVTYFFYVSLLQGLPVNFSK